MIRSAAAAGAVLAVLGLGLGLGSVGPGASGVGGQRVAGHGVDSHGMSGLGAGGDGAAAGPPPGGSPGSAPGPGPGALPSYLAPLDGPVVVLRPFRGPPQPWAAGHRGVDLAARPGQAVRSPAGGVVTFAGTVVDRGVLTVTHDDGLRSSLEPVVVSVGAGLRVLPGQALGTVADVPGHCPTAACLHWGLRRGETYLDPMAWVLGRGPVVLLPEG